MSAAKPLRLELKEEGGSWLVQWSTGFVVAGFSSEGVAAAFVVDWLTGISATHGERQDQKEEMRKAVGAILLGPPEGKH